MTGELIQDVRDMTNASATDATDAEIRRELERARRLVNVELEWHPQQVASGTVEYRLGQVRPWGNFAPGTAGQTNGGTLSVGTLRNSVGGTLGGWSVDRDGMVNFGTPIYAGSCYYFTAYGYDLHRAAADLLENMAATELRQFDVNVSGDDVKRSQKAAALTAHSKMLRKRQLPRRVVVHRTDEA